MYQKMLSELDKREARVKKDTLMDLFLKMNSKKK